jgi:dTMP kinase
MIIAFEGIDGSGKTLQMNMLQQRLREKEADFYFIKQPYMTLLGHTLREYLQKQHLGDFAPQLLALMFAANRIEMLKMSQLHENKLILFDRCHWSNLVYSDLDRKWFDEIEKHSPKPDLTILFDIDPDVAIERVTGDEVYENIENLYAVRQRYLELAKEPENMFEVIKVEDKLPEEVAIEVDQILEDCGVLK